MSKDKMNELALSNKEIGVLKLKTQEQNSVFHESNNTPLGKFFINKDGVFDFEGDCTESAKVFVREVKKTFNLK
tara:strand:- start:325 stop:546 length:222 start_codon:yes stop_codon:yes gene_type:complete